MQNINFMYIPDVLLNYAGVLACNKTFIWLMKWKWSLVRAWYRFLFPFSSLLQSTVEIHAGDKAAFIGKGMIISGPSQKPGPQNY